MNKRLLVIVKLGGSVITDKSKGKGAFRRDVVKRLVSEIVEAKRKKEFDLILVHGTGSFGHPLAKKYKLEKGYLGPKSLEGFAKTKRALFDLSLLFWQEIEKAGLNACIVHSGEAIEATNGKIRNFDTRFIEALIAKKVVPILFGDVVIDDKLGFSVISSDVTVACLSKKLEAKKIIFVSDVDGVFDKNPKINKDAHLIKNVNKLNYLKIIEGFESSNNHDVTDEMKGKILAIKESLSGFEVQIINGFSKGALRRTLAGESEGTSFLF